MGMLLSKISSSAKPSSISGCARPPVPTHSRVGLCLRCCRSTSRFDLSKTSYPANISYFMKAALGPSMFHQKHVTLAKLLIGLTLASLALSAFGQTTWLAENGYVHFKSDAPLEIIEAESHDLKGAIDPTENTFAFTLDISSFQGFNSALQRTHFNENYLESNLYPKAIFSGKIIEAIDWSKTEQHLVRAKGIFEIHGQKKERIIQGMISVHEDGSLSISASFVIMLEDHNIAIPKIVSQKIAENINVDIQIEFHRRENE